MLNWEIILEKPRSKKPSTRKPYVSLNKRGEIAMNAEAFSRIREPASVTLLYDRQSRIIGVKFPVARDRGEFFVVRSYGRGRKMRIVRAARLLKQFRVEINETLAFRNTETTIYDREPMLILRLEAGEKIVRSPSRYIDKPYS